MRGGFEPIVSCSPASFAQKQPANVHNRRRVLCIIQPDFDRDSGTFGIPQDCQCGSCQCQYGDQRTNATSYTPKHVLWPLRGALYSHYGMRRLSALLEWALRVWFGIGTSDTRSYAMPRTSDVSGRPIRTRCNDAWRG